MPQGAGTDRNSALEMYVRPREPTEESFDRRIGALACVTSRDAAFDLRDGYELLDRVVDRRVSRQRSQRFDEAITREAFRHNRILRFIAIARREQRRGAARVGPKLGPRISKRCKSFGNQHFRRPPQLALGAGVAGLARRSFATVQIQSPRPTFLTNSLLIAPTSARTGVVVAGR